MGVLVWAMGHQQSVWGEGEARHLSSHHPGGSPSYSTGLWREVLTREGPRALFWMSQETQSVPEGCLWMERSSTSHSFKATGESPRPDTHERERHLWGRVTKHSTLPNVPWAWT